MTKRDVMLVRALVGYERFVEDMLRLVEEGKEPDTFMVHDKQVLRKMRCVVDMVSCMRKKLYGNCGGTESC